jgi:hypothetical protein
VKATDGEERDRVGARAQDTALPASVAEIWRGEQSDSGWARGAARALSDKLDDVVGTDVSVVEIECRTTMCTAEFVAANTGALIRFQERLFGGGDGWLGAVSFKNRSPSPNGELTVLGYFFRDGYEVPLTAEDSVSEE